MALPIGALFTNDDLVGEILSQIHQGQSSRLDEALFQRNDGTQVPVSLSVSPIRKAGGQLTGSAIIARDISARKQAEREMAHRAMHDHLTGLPNRLLLAEGLATSIAAPIWTVREPPSSLWTWMDSSSSTTRWGTRPATIFCSRWPSG